MSFCVPLVIIYTHGEEKEVIKVSKGGSEYTDRGRGEKGRV
jgi:hypothetical protein